MLATWGTRAVARNSVIAFKPLYKAVILINHFTSPRTLATAATAVKKTTKTPSVTIGKAKAPAKKASAATPAKPAGKKAAAKPAATKTKVKTTTAKKTTADAPVKRGRKPKPKTDEEQNAEKVKETVKLLIAKALDPPTIHSVASTWLAFISDKCAASKASGESVFGLLKAHGPAWTQEYKSLTPAQLEVLRTKAASQKEAKNQSLQEWVNQHTPAEVHEANNARSRLRLLKKTLENPPRGLKGDPFYAIPDPRYPKKPRTPNIFYAMDMVRDAAPAEKIGILSTAMKDYSSLPASEHKKYQDMHSADVTRYHNELRTIGINPAVVSSSA